MSRHSIVYCSGILSSYYYMILSDLFLFVSIFYGVICAIVSLDQKYDGVIQIITEVLDKKESTINKNMFLTGHTILEADIRLLVTLIRFDAMYCVHFKPNTKTYWQYYMCNFIMLIIVFNISCGH